MIQVARSLTWLLIFGAIACRGRRAPVVEPLHQHEARRVMERFVAFRLEPAGMPPPSLGSREATSEVPGVEGTARLVLAEDAPWNQWPGPTSRLFNNRSAHLFDLDIRSDGHDVRWIPERTTLELNVVGNVLRPAATQEALLEELVFWAFQQERAVLDGDLVDRTRAAGDLRRAYLPREPKERLQGIVAFPLVVTDENEEHLGDLAPSELHVVSMRLTVGLEVEGTTSSLVWLLE